MRLVPHPFPPSEQPPLSNGDDSLRVSAPFGGTSGRVMGHGTDVLVTRGALLQLEPDLVQVLAQARVTIFDRPLRKVQPWRYLPPDASATKATS
jgi:hypothetical protein